MGGEVKLVKSLRNLAQQYAGVSFFLGFVLVLVTYWTVSEQFAVAAPNGISRLSPPPVTHVKETASPMIEEEKGDLQLEKQSAKAAEDIKDEESLKEKAEIEITIGNTQPTVTSSNNPFENENKDSFDSKQQSESAMHQETQNRMPVCDVEHPSSDICDIRGDVRVQGSSLTIQIVPENPAGNPDAQEWKIRPYSRKHITSFKQIAVKELRTAREAAACTVKEDVPAVVFALGGLIGNYWHDYSDMIIPLYLASRKFDGEVRFLVENVQGWYIGKYRPILEKLSRYEIIDLDKDDQVRCYRHVVVGIRLHKEFSIDPAKPPVGNSMPEFTKFLRSVYSLPRDAPTKFSPEDTAGKKPRLMIISRRHPRKIVNLQETVQLAERVGFEVVIGDPPFNVNVGEFAKDVNSCDALMGVHGAGLTNSLFLPTGAAFIQVVPYGNMEGLCHVDFGEPAVDMKLQYLKYSITAEESTLVELLGRDHPAIRDPDAIHRSGWAKVAEYYLGKQDVRLELERFEPVLVRALHLLKQ